jgi:hypothetical protein
MMPVNLTNAQDAQQQYLDYLDNMKSAQQALTDVLQSWRGAFDGAADQPTPLWSLEPVQPKELVETTFGFVERMVAAQKQLAIAFVDVGVSEAA